MAQQFTNNARSTITSTISASDTTLTVQSAAADLFPVADVGTGSIPSANSWFKATLQDVSGNVEIIYVRTRNAGSAVFSNIIRAREGTTAREFIAGTIVGLRVTAADIENVVGLPEQNNTFTGTNTFTGPVSGAGLIDAIYPVGSIYINATNNTNPGTLLGVGTWVAFGAGRVPVGFNASDSLFDAAEKTGGSKDAIVVAHTHTGTTGNQSNDHAHGFSATTGGQSANHTHSGTTDGVGNHAHSLTLFNTSLNLSGGATPLGVGGAGSSNTGGAGAHSHTFGTSGVSNDHSHNVSGSTGGVNSNHNHSFTTASSGSSGTNANVQPFITVFMWKRTA